MSPYFVGEERRETFRDGHLKLKHKDLSWNKKQRTLKFQMGKDGNYSELLDFLEYRKVYNIIWKTAVILSFNFLVPMLPNRHFEFYLFSLW